MQLKEIKAAVLRKGWAGRTLSRAETAERLNPLLRQHIALNRAWDLALSACEDPDLEASSAALLKTSRMDVDKLSETVLSCGAEAHAGLEKDPLPAGPAPLLDVVELEGAYAEALRDERQVEHRMRTRAVLARLEENAQARLEHARGAVRQLRLRRQA